MRAGVLGPALGHHLRVHLARPFVNFDNVLRGGVIDFEDLGCLLNCHALVVNSLDQLGSLVQLHRDIRPLGPEYLLLGTLLGRLDLQIDVLRGHVNWLLSFGVHLIDF